MYIDWYYIVLVMPALLFAMWASSRVNTTFKKYSAQSISCGLSGRDAARMILDAHGLHHVAIEHISGELTDHYDPKANVVRLSDGVYSGRSSAAVGVAAHECGHAVQHAEGYLPVKIRSAIVPITNIGAKISVPLIILGLMFSYLGSVFVYIAYAGVACFSLSTLFQLVTLPTEYNASRRAVAVLQSSGRLTDEELRGTKKVLSAAALTYVAALAVSIMQLLRLLLIVAGRSGRNRR